MQTTSVQSKVLKTCLSILLLRFFSILSFSSLCDMNNATKYLLFLRLCGLEMHIWFCCWTLMFIR